MKKGFKKIMPIIMKVDDVVAPFSIEMRTRDSVIIGGVGRVLESTRECVRLALRNGECLELRGVCLGCTSFGSCSIEIRGSLRYLSFDGGKTDEKNI